MNRLLQILIIIVILPSPKALAPDRYNDTPLPSSPKNSDMATTHAQEHQTLTDQQEAETNAALKKQAADKNKIFVTHNALTGKLDEDTQKKLRSALDDHNAKADKDDTAREEKHKQERDQLNTKQAKELANANSWTGKLSNLFSRNDRESNLPESPKSPKKEKTWTDTAYDLVGKGHKDAALKIIKQDKEAFAQNPEILKKALENLTPAEQTEVLNDWKKQYKNNFQAFRKDLNELFKNLRAILPDDQRVSLYQETPGKTSSWRSELNLKELSYKDLHPQDIHIFITDTIPTLKESKTSIVNRFDKETESSLLSTARLKNIVFDKLKDFNTPDRETILNNWIKSWDDKYKNKESLIQKTFFTKSIIESTRDKAHEEQKTLTFKFMRGVGDMLESANEILPRGQKLILVDSRGKPANEEFFNHITKSLGDGTSAESGAANMNIRKEFNPANFKFKIVSE